MNRGKSYSTPQTVEPIVWIGHLSERRDNGGCELGIFEHGVVAEGSFQNNPSGLERGAGEG